MKKQVNQFRDAIFIVTQERGCPIYNVGQEIKVENYSLSVSAYKPGCLYLTEEVIKLVTSRDSFGGFSKFGSQKAVFNCGGCEGLIHFEFKKEKEYATLQMKLLNEAEEKRRKKHLDQFFGVLRKLSIFEPLEDDALSDLTLLLELKKFPVDKIVIKKGEPASNLCILLQGRVAVIGVDGDKIAEMGAGEIFGEMSLLSGEPTNNTVQTIEPSHLAMLSVKNFRQAIVKYPILQVFIFKMLVERAQTMALRSGNITSGMNGELSEISMVDLFQLINSAQKTGMIELMLNQGKAYVLFKDGQIVHARYQKMRNQEAIFSMLGEKEGHFTYTKGLPEELSKLPPIGDFMAVLMNGLQKIDEQNAGA